MRTPKYWKTINWLMINLEYAMSEWATKSGNEKKEWGKEVKESRECIKLINPHYYNGEFMKWYNGRCESWKYPKLRTPR